MATIGFVGLGHMGLPMAVNLMNAGHTVTGFDIQADAIQALISASGQAADSLQSLAHEKDIIITMLQTGEQVKKVCLGKNGLMNAASSNTLFIDCSSIDVNSSLEFHHHAREHQFNAVDAPVSGGVAGAQAGNLTIMVGGDKSAFQLAMPILEIMGQTIIHTGDKGSGQAAKICNNMILGISMIAISEAFVLAEKLGLSAQKLHEVVTQASGQCWAMNNYVPVPGILDGVPAEHDYQPGFTASMMLKDLATSQQSAMTAGVDTPMGKLASDIYQQFKLQGSGELDFSAIIKCIENHN